MPFHYRSLLMHSLIHDVIHENRLDVLCMTETWITSDAPNAVRLDVAPPGYNVIHRVFE